MSWLYKFEINGTFYRFSPSILPKTLDNFTYSPTVIKHGNIRLTDNFLKNEVTITFPRTNSFAKGLLANLLDNPVKVTIYKNGIAFWGGSVYYTKANIATIEVTCQSKASTLRTTGTPRRISLLCNHTIYDQNCKVDKASFVHEYSVSGITSNIFTLIVSEASDYYTGGLAVINGQTRRILSHSGSTFTLTFPFNGVQSGTMQLYPDCNLTKENCIAFSNLNNFGGFPYIPQKNPFGSSGAL